MQNNDFWIPRTLDAPKLFLLWEVDVFAIYFIFLLMGLAMQTVLLGIASALVFGRVYSKIKAEGGQGLVGKLMYWYMPSDLWLSKHYPSSVREYLGG